MSSKYNGNSFFNDKQVVLDSDVNLGDKNQFTNLNLNQNMKVWKLDSTKNSFSKTNVQPFDNYYGNDAPFSKNNLQFSNKNSCSKSSFVTNFIEFTKSSKDKNKSINNNPKNRSTLSLHILAYENNNVASDVIEIAGCNQLQRKNELKVRPENVENFYKNGFEFPRQQENKATPPEVTTFRASQRLLNPNEPKSKNETPVKRPLPALIPSDVNIGLIEPALKKAQNDSTNLSSPNSSNEISARQIDNFFIAANQKLSTSLTTTPTSAKPPAKTIRPQLTPVTKSVMDNIFAKEPQTKESKIDEKLQRAYDDKRNLQKRYDRLSDLKQRQEEIFENEIQRIKTEEKENTERVVGELKEELLISSETVKSLMDEVQQLKKANSNQNVEMGVVELTVKGRYKNEVKLGIAKLKGCNVSDNKVPEVISIVLEMIGMKADSLPSEATVRRCTFFLRALNRAQLREMLHASVLRSIPSTLSSDETKKQGDTVQNYLYTTVDETDQIRTYVIGIRKVLDKAAATSVEKLEYIVKELDSENGNVLWESCVMSIGNVMSDHAATQTKFNEILENLKKIILETSARWQDLNEAEKENLSKIQKFFCHLHVLQNVTPIVIKALLNEENIPNQNEPTVFKLIKEVARHFGERAASRLNTRNAWRQHIRVNGLKYAHIPDFKGHRFNILFAIAAALYYLKNEIIKFSESYSTHMNSTPIISWLKDTNVLTQRHILAEINRSITAPLWRLIESSTNMSEVTEHAQSLLSFLKNVKEEPLLLFSGTTAFDEFEDSHPDAKRSKAHSLHLDSAPVEDPDYASFVIENIVDELIPYFKKQFADYLPGGKYHNLSEESVKTVPKSNKLCEFVFSNIDYGYKLAPNQRFVRRETQVMARVNRVFEWFSRKNEDEQKNILQEALFAAPQLAKDAAEEEKNLQDAINKRLREQHSLEVIAAKAKQDKKDKACQDVSLYGGEWSSHEIMDEYLQNLSEAKQKKAIAAQLKYHKFVLETEKQSSTLFTLSFKGEPKKLPQLIRQLHSLIDMKIENCEEEEDV